FDRLIRNVGWPTKFSAMSGVNFELYTCQLVSRCLPYLSENVSSMTTPWTELTEIPFIRTIGTSIPSQREKLRTHNTISNRYAMLHPTDHASRSLRNLVRALVRAWTDANKFICVLRALCK